MRLKHLSHEGCGHWKADRERFSALVEDEDDGMIRLTFFVGVDRSDMPLQVFATAEAFATVLHFADINSALFALGVLGFGRSIPCGWHASAATLLCEVRNWYGRRGAYARAAAFGGERAGRGVQKGIFSGGRRYTRDDGWRFHRRGGSVSSTRVIEDDAGSKRGGSTLGILAG